jgi:hypothetical protein
MNKWLYARSELYRKYAGSLPETLSQVEMIFSAPDVGWLPVKFNISNKESEDIEFSVVYDPIPELIQWLEYIVKNRWSGGSYITIDCERYNTIFSYEVMVEPELEECKRPIHPTNCGLFTVYDTYSQQFIVEAFCQTEELVKSLYTSLTEFIKKVISDKDLEEQWDVDLKMYQELLNNHILNSFCYG